MYEYNQDDAFRFARHVGIPVHTERGNLVFNKCPYCQGETNKKYKFAIRLDNGQFNCFRASCGAKGNMLTLAKDFNFSLGSEVDEYIHPKRHYKRILKKAEDIVVRDPAVEYMASRGISREVVERYHITMTEDGKSIVMPFQDEYGDIQFIKYRNPNPKKNQGKEYSEKDCKPILYGMYQCNPENDTLIVTEGQMDSLSLAEAGIENAVSVPTGAKGFTWVPHCWDWMTQFKKIIVFGDLENGHISLLDEMISRWSNKIWHVQGKDYKGCKDANEILQKYGAEQLRKCVENSVSAPIMRVIPLSDVENVDVEMIEKCATGFTSVDQLLNGGLPFGQIILITGKAGDGKSTFASQLLLSAMQQAYRVFAYSGELPNFQFKNWITSQAAGIDPQYTETFDYYYTVDFPEEQKPRKVTDEANEKICEWYRDKIWLYDNSHITSDEDDELIPLLESVINKYGVKVILIDNLMTGIDMEPIDGNDKFDRQSRFMKKLARMALKYKVLILLVAHKRKDIGSHSTNDNVSGTSDITNLASVVLSYERDYRKDKKTGEFLTDPSCRLLKVTKNRLYGKLCTDGYLMQYEPNSKRIYTNQEELNKRYVWALKLPFNDKEQDDV